MTPRTTRWIWILVLLTAGSGVAGAVDDPVRRVALGDAAGAAAIVDTGAGLLVVDGPQDLAHLPPQAADAPRWRLETGADRRAAVAPGPELTLGVDGDAPRPELVFAGRIGLGDRAEVLTLGRGVSAADLVVHLPGDGVLIAGDLVSSPPVVGPDTDTRAWIASLARLERLAPTAVIPRLGPAGDAGLLMARRQLLEDLRREIWSDLLAGRGWPQVRARHATSANETLVRHVFDEIAGTVAPRELLVERGLEPGPSPTREDAGWRPPRKVVWRNLWPDRLPALEVIAPGVEIVPVSTAAEAAAAAPGADAVIGMLTPEILAVGDRLRWVQVPWAGVEDEVGIPGLAASGITLTNGQRLASPEIAEHVMALTRALARRLDVALDAQTDGTWQRSRYRESELLRLRGKTLLVVGLGGIGTEVARLADAAGMTVLATRSSSRTGPDFVAEVGLAHELPDFLARADVVVNCLPLTDATRGLFDRAAFRRMPSDALFVNVGRGGTVVTADLIAALEAAELGGAGLDVTDPEPLPEDHPLWSAPRVIITPHAAAVSDAGWERMWLLFRENLRRFVAGEPLLSVVDIERGY